ncbi:MAG: hypothetical protein SFY68_11125 [Candidatus Sumerlaeia bacterium]|nr:hypothetical protein [Candidatus Sumerlaeia bacterium]
MHERSISSSARNQMRAIANSLEASALDQLPPSQIASLYSVSAPIEVSITDHLLQYEVRISFFHNLIYSFGFIPLIITLILLLALIPTSRTMKYLSWIHEMSPRTIVCWLLFFFLVFQVLISEKSVLERNSFKTTPDPAYRYVLLDQELVLISVGLDGVSQVSENVFPLNSKTPEDLRTALIQNSYDPTNGTLSSGDLLYWRSLE